MAKRLDVVKFNCPLSAQLQTHAGGLAESANPAFRPKNCYKMGDRWYVRIFFRGVQHCWAARDLFGFEEAFRIADMITKYLNGKRVRKAKSFLSDDDFNLSAAQVERDLESEPEILSIIIQMVASLPEPAPRKPRVVVNKVRTARDQFESMLNRITDIERTLLRIESKLDALTLRNPVSIVQPATETPPPQTPLPGTSWIGDPPASPIFS